MFKTGTSSTLFFIRKPWLSKGEGAKTKLVYSYPFLDV